MTARAPKHNHRRGRNESDSSEGSVLRALCLTTIAAVSAQTPPAGAPRTGVLAVPQRRAPPRRSPRGQRIPPHERFRNQPLLAIPQWTAVWSRWSLVGRQDRRLERRNYSRPAEEDGWHLRRANRSAIVSTYKAYLKAQEHLDAFNKSTNPDQSQVFSAIDSVNQARSGHMQKAASAMLLKIRKEMNPDQIDKLSKLQ